MAIRNRFSELLPEITAWRRDIHENPELLFETTRTSQFVTDRLAEFGCDEIVTGIGRTGVVALIKGRSDSKGKVVGLRADMDALPIEEATGLPYASKTPVSCMPAAMMATRPCFWELPNISPKHAILTEPWR